MYACAVEIRKPGRDAHERRAASASRSMSGGGENLGGNRRRKLLPQIDARVGDHYDNCRGHEPDKMARHSTQARPASLPRRTW